MKSSELNNKTRDELSRLLAEYRAKILKLNFDLADNKVKDVSQVKKTKKDIARIMTMIKHLNK